MHVVCANGPFPVPVCLRCRVCHHLREKVSTQLSGIVRPIWENVGIIGTGASAAQVITSICDDVDSLTVFQRTATWALPRDDEPTPPEIVKAFKDGGYSEKLRYVDWKGNFLQTRMLRSLLTCCTTRSKTVPFVKA